MVRPWEEGLGAYGHGVLFLLVAALLNANYQIITRKVRGDDPLTSLLYTAAAGAVVTSCHRAVVLDLADAVRLAAAGGSGVAGGLGHLFLIRAFRAAPASVVAPFSYSSLIWAALFGFVIWGDWPDLWTWAGAAHYHRVGTVHLPPGATAA